MMKWLMKLSDVEFKEVEKNMKEFPYRAVKGSLMAISTDLIFILKANI